MTISKEQAREICSRLEHLSKRHYSYVTRASYGEGCLFEGLTTKLLKQLLQDGLADPKEAQNDSPTTQEFYDFMKEHEGFTAHGYVIGPEREDRRITLEGLTGTACDEEGLEQHAKLFHHADEFNYNPPHCWWD